MRLSILLRYIRVVRGACLECIMAASMWLLQAVCVRLREYIRDSCNTICSHTRVVDTCAPCMPLLRRQKEISLSAAK